MGSLCIIFITACEFTLKKKIRDVGFYFRKREIKTFKGIFKIIFSLK